MRISFALLFMLLFSGIVTAQNDNAPFYGNWEATINGNQIFKVELFNNDENRVRGHYYLYQIDSNGLETLVYTSKVDLGSGNYLGPLIYGGSDGVELGAGISDINHQEHKYRRLLGHLDMLITSGNGEIGTIAIWKVKRKQGLRLADDDRQFIIPTELTLTKVSN
jgi:hypothetical protein